MYFGDVAWFVQAKILCPVKVMGIRSLRWEQHFKYHNWQPLGFHTYQTFRKHDGSHAAPDEAGLIVPIPDAVHLSIINHVPGDTAVRWVVTLEFIQSTRGRENGLICKKWRSQEIQWQWCWVISWDEGISMKTVQDGLISWERHFAEDTFSTSWSTSETAKTQNGKKDNTTALAQRKSNWICYQSRVQRWSPLWSQLFSHEDTEHTNFVPSRSGKIQSHRSCKKLRCVCLDSIQLDTSHTEQSEDWWNFQVGKDLKCFPCFVFVRLEIRQFVWEEHTSVRHTRTRRLALSACLVGCFHIRAVETKLLPSFTLIKTNSTRHTAQLICPVLVMSCFTFQTVLIGQAFVCSKATRIWKKTCKWKTSKIISTQTVEPQWTTSLPEHCEM